MRTTTIQTDLLGEEMRTTIGVDQKQGMTETRVFSSTRRQEGDAQEDRMRMTQTIPSPT